MRLHEIILEQQCVASIVKVQFVILGKEYRCFGLVVRFNYQPKVIFINNGGHETQQSTIFLHNCKQNLEHSNWLSNVDICDLDLTKNKTKKDNTVADRVK